MVTLQDCIDMADLSEEVVDAIAEHEKLPCILATELGSCLACSKGGLLRIHACIMDEMEAAIGRGDEQQVGKMNRALHQFVAAHPEFGS